jgi:hypothetical protein
LLQAVALPPTGAASGWPSDPARFGAKLHLLHGLLLDETGARLADVRHAYKDALAVAEERKLDKSCDRLL